MREFGLVEGCVGTGGVEPELRSRACRPRSGVGSARRWRAVFGGSPKTSCHSLFRVAKKVRTRIRRIGRAACAPHFYFRIRAEFVPPAPPHFRMANSPCRCHSVSVIRPNQPISRHAYVPRPGLGSAAKAGQALQNRQTHKLRLSPLYCPRSSHYWP